MSQEVLLSAVVPLRDEAESLPGLHRELVQALEGLGVGWEVVYVDDGSTDGGPIILAGLATDPRVKVVRLDRAYGQSTALVAGAERARGRWLVTLDADGQNDPTDIPALWLALGESGADVVQGIRVRRADGWLRRASSRIANAVRDRLSGDRVTDVGCSLRIMPRDLFLAAPRFEGMHRFLPTLLRMVGGTVVERPVGHRPRRAGRSKYTIRNRIWKGLADLMMVRRLRRGWVRYGVRDGDPGPLSPGDPI
ncbi:MAG TPA: glycosyltransferase family 2 protein [Gemmatimonadota bacterium]|nr:glycosyltransferase family 2 protein [Gemmatimonadota bacterium]